VITASDYLITKEKFDIIECKECTLRFTSPIPSETEIDIFYKSDEYISHSDKGKSLINKIYKIVQKITLRSKRQIVEKMVTEQNGTFLDFGCGSGDFLHTMQQSGWKVSGVEVNESARKIAEYKLEISISSPNEFLNDDIKYDVITMWHSLEHLHDLKKYLQKITTSLNTNGVLMIALPNYLSFDAKHYKENWAAYDVPRHLYHFSFESIVNLLNEFGFKLIKYRHLPFDPFYVSLLSELFVKRERNIISAMWIGLKSYLGGAKNARKGSSILYIFKK
jgi:2-polyprenyl-3-methyl-5-hydroxy-6-metoxy-1,4-benzoquinol methylase